MQFSESLKGITIPCHMWGLQLTQGRGYEANDVDGRMKRYAQVLIYLNGGQGCIQLFVQKHYLMFERESLGNPVDCFQ